MVRQQLLSFLVETQPGGHYASASGIARIERVLESMRRAGYLPEEYSSASGKVFKADMTLLLAVINCQNHFLRSTFPAVVVRSHDLRHRTHDFQFLSHRQR